MTTISLVIPVFNEEAVVDVFYAELNIVLTKLEFKFEIIFVDDGSQDGTWDKLDHIQANDHQVKLLCLSRNFGHQAALLAGIEKATGDCVITMDGDLEHPPELIPVLIKKWQGGTEVVNTRRHSEGSLSFSKKITSELFYKIFRFLSDLELEPGMADYRLLDRLVVDALQNIQERTLFLRGIFQWIGFTQDIVDYDVGQRSAGNSKYSLPKMLQLALNGITSFSVVPLRIATLLGFTFSFVSFLYLIYATMSWIFTDYSADMWKAVIGALLLLGGVQLICLGIIGEYIGRVFLEVKSRPVYIVRLDKGFDND